MGKCTWPTAAGPDLDELVKVTAADTTADYLNSKVAAGAGIAKSTLNPGGNEQLQIACTVVNTDQLVKVSAADTTASYLASKIAAGANIALVILNPGGNEQLQISASGGLSADYGPEFAHAELWGNPDDTGTLLQDTRSTPEIRLRAWQMVQNTILSYQTIIPVQWTGAPISAKFFFYMSSDSSPDTHTFSVGARAIKEDETIDTAIAYSTTMSGTASGVSNRAFFTTVSFTPANSPAAGDGLFFKFKRTDDESGTLRFLGAKFNWRCQ